MNFELLKSAFSFLQKIGKALMLPVAVLPVAGILLGVGTGLLNADISWLPDLIPNVMRLSGSVIFDNMPLIFAIGTALALELLFLVAFAVRMRYKAGGIEVGVSFGWKIHLQIDVQSVGFEVPALIERLGNLMIIAFACNQKHWK